MTEPTYRIHSDVAWRIVDGELFAVTPDGNLHHVESPTGVFVWKMLDGRAPSASECAAAVTEAFEVDLETARKDLAEFLEQLVSLGVVVKG